MHRRNLLTTASSVALASLAPRMTRAQGSAHRCADMHTHLGYRPEPSMREAMAEGPTLREALAV